MDAFLPTILVLLVVLVATLVGGFIAVGYLLSRRARDDVAAAATLRNLTELVSGVQTELRGISERVSAVERSNSQVAGGVTAVAAKLAETGAVAGSLSEATSAIRAQLNRAQVSLTTLQTQTDARRELEQETAGSIRRLEAIIAGSKSKGAAGENIVDAALAQLPPEWQARDFRVGNKMVEFGLRLPNGLVLPIDSKWPATSLVERLSACDVPSERRNLKTQIEREVVNRAREVTKYVDPSVTPGFAVAAVPDAIYEVCSSAQVEAFRLNVVLVSYSMFVPYLLLVFHTIMKNSQNIDLDRLSAHLDSARASLTGLQEEIDGRFAKAMTMLGNSRDEMRARAGRASSSLIALQLGGPPRPTPPPGPRPQWPDRRAEA